jgi:hypothetical protein
MDDIIVMKPVFEKAICPEAEGKGLGKAHGGDPGPFHEIDGIGELLQGRHSEEIIGVIEVEAGEAMANNIVIELRVRRA